MSQPRLCICSQTPLVRFLKEAPTSPTPVPLSHFVEGEDYQLSPGGVSRMVGGLLRRLTQQGRIAHGTWISLARKGPPGGSEARAPQASSRPRALPRSC